MSQQPSISGLRTWTPCFAHGASRLVVLVCLWLSMLVLTVPAAVVVENFSSYNLGQLEGQSGGTGLSGNWAGNENNIIVSGNLTGPAISASLILPQSGPAQSVQVSSSSSYTDSQTRISLATSFSGVTWVSFVVQVTGNYRIGLGFNSTGVHTDNQVDGNLFFNNGAPDGPALQARRNPVQGATTTGSTLLTGLGTSFFVVARMDTSAAANNINVWLNPTTFSAFSGAPSIANASIDFTGDQISGFSVLGFNSASQIDNIRFGSELSHVVSPIPEPGTVALLFVGLLSIFVYLSRVRRSSAPNPLT